MDTKNLQFSLGTTSIASVISSAITIYNNECQYCSRFVDFRYKKFCSTKCEWKYDEKLESRTAKAKTVLYSLESFKSIETRLDVLEKRIDFLGENSKK